VAVAVFAGAIEGTGAVGKAVVDLAKKLGYEEIEDIEKAVVAFVVERKNPIVEDEAVGSTNEFGLEGECFARETDMS
jgi:hypothetical protein